MTALLFKCPYCYFDIPEPATVCGHCTRDLSLIKPLLFQFSRSIEDITTLRLEINEIRKELENIPLLHDRLNTEITISSNNEEYQEVINKVSGAKGLLFLASTVLLTVIALVFTHWLFLFVYDFNLLLLRIATVILPLLFGILSYRKIDVNAGLSILSSTLLGILTCYLKKMLLVSLKLLCGRIKSNHSLRQLALSYQQEQLSFLDLMFSYHDLQANGNSIS